MSDYPAWVKPHLRRRLEEEQAAKNPQPTNGLTPIAPQATSTPVAKASPIVTYGDTVKVCRPSNLSDGPGWADDMDPYAGLSLTVTYVWQERIRGIDLVLFNVEEDNGEWAWSSSWIV